VFVYRSPFNRSSPFRQAARDPPCGQRYRIATGRFPKLLCREVTPLARTKPTRVWRGTSQWWIAAGVKEPRSAPKRYRRSREENMHGIVTQFSKIRTETEERIADLRDSLALARDTLTRSVEEGASERMLRELRAKVVSLMEQVEKLQATVRPRM
jgi:hypothetical protein